jgi:hypothetical protein
MNQKKTSWWLIVGGGMLAGLVLVACLALALKFTGPTASGGYSSNGEQIYFTATSQRGMPIVSDIGTGMMGGGMMTCANCHGPDGHGGRVQMMMRTFVAPDVRYKTLTSEEMEHEGEEVHPPYTDETIKQAITEGIEPNGEPLDWPMPRWSMSDEDLDDLLAFLKTLD